MNDRDFFEEMILILNQQKEIHRRLIGSAEQMNKCIRQTNSQELKSACTIYDEQVCLLEKFEERRIECCSRISARYNLLQSARLNTLLQYAGDESSRKLKTLSNELKDLIKQLTAINESNRIMLEESVKTLSQVFDIIKLNTAGFDGYRHKGDRKSGKPELAFINELV